MDNTIELEDFDFGFTSVSEEEITSPVVEQVSNGKAEKMYKMILPLLKNLEKDSDKNAYIHWPDRKVKIQQFIKKLEAVLHEN